MNKITFIALVILGVSMILKGLSYYINYINIGLTIFGIIILVLILLLEISNKNKIFTLLLLIVLTGGIMNILAIIGNGGTMPVYSETERGDIASHSYINDLEEIKFKGLIDRYYMKYLGTASIGDFFIFCGFIIYMPSKLIMIRRNNKKHILKSRSIYKENN